MKNSKKPFWIILLVLSSAICLGCVIYFISYFSSGSDQSEYKTATTVAETNLETTTAESVSNVETTEKLAENPVNWSKLQQKNADIYAWITIPNTKIDYAITQAGDDKDDSFYLDHNITGDYEFAGSIYSEKQNAKDFSDPVTVLYGHNMLNGTMFAGLHKFEDSKFFKKNQYIYVYTPQHKYTYKIYSAYTYDDRHVLNSFDFNNKKIRMSYFRSTLHPNSMNKNVRKDTKLNKKSKILTLSTCTRGAENTRYIVQGVLENVENTN